MHPNEYEWTYMSWMIFRDINGMCKYWKMLERENKLEHVQDRGKLEYDIS